jgi:uncharacterized protein (TIGR00255 family)
LPLATAYRHAYIQIAEHLGLQNDVRVMDVAGLPGVVRLEERGVNLDHARQALSSALDQALEGLGEMRRSEGSAIRADLDSRLAAVQRTAEEVASLAPRVVEEYRTRLSERVNELARGVGVDPQRLAQEVALFAERTDVAEEVTRLKSHIDQFRSLLDAKEPAGRKMDFLVQEMHREVNTTGSKSQHADISTRIVSLKAELERIREQVQNVE